MSAVAPTSASDYQLLHIHDSRVPEIIVAMAVCLPAAYIAISLRFLSRRVGKVPLKADDWWLVVGLVGRHLFRAPLVSSKADTVVQPAFHDCICHLRGCRYSPRPWSPRYSSQKAHNIRESIAHYHSALYRLISLYLVSFSSCYT